MSIRLIALDLDGTLVNSRWEISEADRCALREASERGIEIVVITGRRPVAAAPYVAKLPCPVTVVTSNGALIRTCDGEVVYRDFLLREIALQVLEVTREFHPYTVAIFDVMCRGQVTMQDTAILEGPLGWYVKTSSEYLQLVPDIRAAITCDPVQLMIGGPIATIEPAEALLRASACDPSVTLTWTKYPERNIALFDIMNAGCSKGRALKFWAAKCGIPASDVMAIGDNFNDRAMLEFAGLPVLMGNHIDGLAQPHWAVTGSSDDSGVAMAISAYVLNPRA